MESPDVVFAPREIASSSSLPLISAFVILSLDSQPLSLSLRHLTPFPRHVVIACVRSSSADDKEYFVRSPSPLCVGGGDDVSSAWPDEG